ncbi:hypothetical protein NE556_22700, partial [[Clostridium] symbiosum]|nr:hypothetical protein [[Clostridium] symbiosum]
EEKDYGCLKEELIYGLTPLISPDYYLKNLSLYEKDRGVGADAEWIPDRTKRAVKSDRIN